MQIKISSIPYRYLRQYVCCNSVWFHLKPKRKKKQSSPNYSLHVCFITKDRIYIGVLD